MMQMQIRMLHPFQNVFPEYNRIVVTTVTAVKKVLLVLYAEFDT